MKKAFVRWVALLLVPCLWMDSLSAAASPFYLSAPLAVQSTHFQNQALVSAALLALHPLSLEAAVSVRQTIAAPPAQVGFTPFQEVLIGVVAFIVLFRFIFRLIRASQGRSQTPRKLRLVLPHAQLQYHHAGEDIFRDWQVPDKWHALPLRQNADLILKALGIEFPVHIQEYVDQPGPHQAHLLRVIKGRRAEDVAADRHVVIWYGARVPLSWDVDDLKGQIQEVADALSPGDIFLYMDPWNGAHVHKLFSTVYVNRTFPAARIDLFNLKPDRPEEFQAIAFIKKQPPRPSLSKPHLVTKGQHVITKPGLLPHEENELAERLLAGGKARFVPSLDPFQAILKNWVETRPSNTVVEFFKRVPLMKTYLRHLVSFLAHSQAAEIDYRGERQPVFDHQGVRYQVIYLPADTPFVIDGKKVGAFKRLREDGVLQIFVHPTMDGFLHEVMEHLVLPWRRVPPYKRHLIAVLSEIVAGAVPFEMGGRIRAFLPLRIDPELSAMGAQEWSDILDYERNQFRTIEIIFSKPAEKNIREFLRSFAQAISLRAKRFQEEDLGHQNVRSYIKQLKGAMFVQVFPRGEDATLPLELVQRFPELFELSENILRWKSTKRVARLPGRSEDHYLKHPIIFASQVVLFRGTKIYTLIPNREANHYTYEEFSNETTIDGDGIRTMNLSVYDDLDGPGVSVQISPLKGNYVLHIKNSQEAPVDIKWDVPHPETPQRARTPVEFVLPLLLPALWMGRLWAEARGLGLPEDAVLGMAALIWPRGGKGLIPHQNRLLAAA